MYTESQVATAALDASLRPDPIDDLFGPMPRRRRPMPSNDWLDKLSDTYVPQANAGPRKRVRLIEHDAEGDLEAVIDLNLRGFAQVPHAIIRSSKVPQSMKLVLLALMSYARGDGGTFVAQAKIAEDLAMKPATVHKALVWLRKNDFIDIRAAGGRRSYEIVFKPKLQNLLKVKSKRATPLAGDRAEDELRLPLSEAFQPIRTPILHAA